jgi:hypothetical protein
MRYADSRTTGRETYNTAMGFEALMGSTTPSDNTGQYNVAIGDQALQANTSGSGNAANGFRALYLNTTGEYNVAVGSGSMRNNTTGSYNASVGRNALYSNVDGYNNTAVGHEALRDNTSGYNNTAIGHSALLNNTEGGYNVAIGSSASESNTTGSLNVAIGYFASLSNTIGNYNTAIGIIALTNNVSGDYRTSIGYSANTAGSSYNNNTGLGYNADCTASNQVRIGSSAITSIGGYANWTNISDARFKREIQENVVGLDFINALRPVTYIMDLKAIDDWWAVNYNDRDSALAELGVEKSKIKYSGFIAQEVEAAAQALGYDFSGVDGPKNEKDFYGLRYAEFTVPLVKAVQELAAENEALRKEITELKKLETRMAALEVLLESRGSGTE